MTNRTLSSTSSNSPINSLQAVVHYNVTFRSRLYTRQLPSSSQFGPLTGMASARSGAWFPPYSLYNTSYLCVPAFHSLQIGSWVQAGSGDLFSPCGALCLEMRWFKTLHQVSGGPPIQRLPYHHPKLSFLDYVPFYSCAERTNAMMPRAFEIKWRRRSFSPRFPLWFSKLAQNNSFRAFEMSDGSELWHFSSPQVGRTKFQRSACHRAISQLVLERFPEYPTH